MKSPSSKRTEEECGAESDTTLALREILGISMNEDHFEPGEAVAVIGAVAERALYRFEEIPSDIGSQFPRRSGPVQFTELTRGRPFL
jgi:hypothetical protein